MIRLNRNRALLMGLNAECTYCPRNIHLQTMGMLKC